MESDAVMSESVASTPYYRGIGKQSQASRARGSNHHPIGAAWMPANRWAHCPLCTILGRGWQASSRTVFGFAARSSDEKSSPPPD